jgi:hypothetical protein
MHVDGDVLALKWILREIERLFLLLHVENIELKFF